MAAARAHDRYDELDRPLQGTVRGLGQYRQMPTISRFRGIAIQMFFKEHGLPHFHARHGDDVAVFAIEPLETIRGELPRSIDRLVREWAALHQTELLRNWDQARAGAPLTTIDPLP